MGHELSGLRDKLYWRRVDDGPWHCFKGLDIGGFGSLCGKHEIAKSGGQDSRRPEPIFRCGRCDGAEMNRRGWDESGPTLAPLLL